METTAIRMSHAVVQTETSEPHALELTHLNRELESMTLLLSQKIRGELRGLAISAHELMAQPMNDLARQEAIRVNEAVDRISFIIDASLRLSQLTRKPLQLEEVNLTELTQRLCEQICFRLRKETVEVEVEPDLITRADSHLLEIALEKLLENAVLFAAQVSSPKVQIGRKWVNERPTFFISDNGPGFSPAQASRIFEPVMRQNTNTASSGLGLATVKRIIERHEGKVWAQSQPGRGATFTFCIGTDLSKPPQSME